MPLFEVAVIAVNENGHEDLVMEPIALVAKNKESAGTLALLKNPGKFEGWRKSDLVVLVRPFV